MNRKKKIVRNLILLLLCSISFFYMNHLYLFPSHANEASERGLHYGPSQVIYETDYELGKYYLCRYDQYISCNSIQRAFGIFWQYGGNHYGTEINKDDPITYNWSMSDSKYWIFFGQINDSNIASLKLTPESSEESFTQNDFHDGMFLFHWIGQNQSCGFQLTAYDKDGTVLYQIPNP